MEDFMIGALAIVILVTIVGCIPYGIWMICSIHKRKWKRFRLQIAIPFAVSTVLMGLWMIGSAKVRRDHLAEIYGTEVELGSAIFKYDSERSFNGDGYSFSVYELPDSVRTRFEAADQNLLSSYPEKPDYRSDWKVVRWRESPLDPGYREYLDFALSSYDRDQAAALSPHFDRIRLALSRGGIFYAFFHKDHGDHAGNIDLFIVDLKEARLYEINHNT